MYKVFRLEDEASRSLFPLSFLPSFLVHNSYLFWLLLLLFIYLYCTVTVFPILPCCSPLLCPPPAPTVNPHLVVHIHGSSTPIPWLDSSILSPFIPLPLPSGLCQDCGFLSLLVYILTNNLCPMKMPSSVYSIANQLLNTSHWSDCICRQQNPMPAFLKLRDIYHSL